MHGIISLKENFAQPFEKEHKKNVENMKRKWDFGVSISFLPLGHSEQVADMDRLLGHADTMSGRHADTKGVVLLMLLSEHDAKDYSVLYTSTRASGSQQKGHPRYLFSISAQCRSLMPWTFGGCRESSPLVPLSASRF